MHVITSKLACGAAALAVSLAVSLATGCDLSEEAALGPDAGSCPESSEREPSELESLQTYLPHALGTPARGLATTVYLPDANRCVPDVVDGLRRLRTNGDVLGFRRAQGYPAMYSCDYGVSSVYMKHWQSVQRVPPRHQRLCVFGSCYDLNQYGRSSYLVADSGHDWDDGSHDDGAHLATVRLGSKVGGADGRRWGPNRTSASYVNGREDWNNLPPASDLIVRNTKLDQYYNHPGGMQFLGNYLFVGLEQFDMSCVLHSASTASSQLRALDYGGLPDTWSTSWSPVTANAWTRDGAGPRNPKYSSGQAVAAAKLAPIGSEASRYLLATDNGGDRSVSFYASQPGATVEDARFEEVARVTYASLGSTINGYNNLNLITECDGDVYLVGMNGSEWVDDQYMDAWRLGITSWGGGSFSVTMTQVDLDLTNSDPAHPLQKHFTCEPHNSGKRQCDFKAAVSTYVDRDGRILAYGMAWDNSTELGGDYVRLMEFRPEDPSDLPGTSASEGCASIADAWVELFKHDLGSGGSPGRVNPSLLIEARRANARAVYAGRGHANLDYAYNFNDTARAVRYCVPSGYHVALFDNNQHTGTARTHTGTGVTQYSNAPSATASSVCFRRNGSSACCTESSGSVRCP